MLMAAFVRSPEIISLCLRQCMPQTCGADPDQQSTRTIEARCTRVVGAFPDGNSCRNLAAARLRRRRKLLRLDQSGVGCGGCGFLLRHRRWKRDFAHRRPLRFGRCSECAPRLGIPRHVRLDNSYSLAAYDVKAERPKAGRSVIRAR